MGLIETTGLHHVRLTVTDLERSKAFYADVLGFQIAAESPGSPDDPDVRKRPGAVVRRRRLSDQRHALRAPLRPRTAGRIARQGLETLAPELR